MNEATSSNARSIAFSIKGEFITNLALEKTYHDYDIIYAIKLILSCTETDQISVGDRIANALAILDGRKELKGTYPGPDYGLYDIPEDKRNPAHNLENLLGRIRDKLSAMEKTLQAQSEKLEYLAEQLTEYRKEQYDSDFEAMYETTADGNRATIFGTNLQHPVEYGSEKEDGADEDIAPRKPSPFFDRADDMLKSFMERQRNPVDEPDYGWLFPDGTFHPVDWGEHQGWAYEWLKEHDPGFNDGLEEKLHLYLTEAGDYLSEHYGAILLHSPWQGIACTTMAENVRMTKAQKEFLYDYYTKRNQHDKANALWRED